MPIKTAIRKTRWVPMLPVKGGTKQYIQYSYMSVYFGTAHSIPAKVTYFCIFFYKNPTQFEKVSVQSEDAMRCLSLLPYQFAPPCVYMRGPSRLEALPGPRCSLSTLRFQRGSRALQQQAAHTASTGKDQEPGEHNLLRINTDLPGSSLSHCFCFLTQDGLGSE